MQRFYYSLWRKATKFRKHQKEAVEGKKERKKTDIEYPVVEGVFMFPNGDKYDGQHKQVDDAIMRVGVGEHTSSEGTVYRGEWQNDTMNGRGVLTHPSGAIYEGDFLNNMMHGHGKYTWPDGSKYEGPFHQNRLEGTGKFTDNKLKVWTGMFSNRTAKDLRYELNM
eukprot:gene12083-13327_t